MFITFMITLCFQSHINPSCSWWSLSSRSVRTAVIYQAAPPTNCTNHFQKQRLLQSFNSWSQSRSGTSPLHSNHVLNPATFTLTHWGCTSILHRSSAEPLRFKQKKKKQSFFLPDLCETDFFSLFFKMFPPYPPGGYELLHYTAKKSKSCQVVLRI